MADPPPAVSVLLPVYEAMPYLTIAVRDLLRQDVAGGLELVAAWDGGAEDSWTFLVDAAAALGDQGSVETVAAQRRMAAGLLLVELDALRTDLSVRECNEEVAALAEKAGVADEAPYKAVLDGLVQRLRATIAWADRELSTEEAVADWPKESRNSLASSFGRLSTLEGKKGGARPLFDEAELLEPLKALHASLLERGFDEWANGRLVDAIRRVGAFGLQLAPLDVRQESTRHANAVDALRAFTGNYAAGSYLALSEDEKVAWLAAELEAGRPLLRRGQFDAFVESGFDDAVDRDVLKTCAVVAEAPPGSFGAYVISQATSAADVLAVELLLAEAGAGPDRRNCSRIVPLFETLDDLTNGPSSLDSLFSAPGYLDRCDSRQEIMVGYSDSAKDAGRLAAWWAQYEGQEKMLKVCDDHGVRRPRGNGPRPG